MREGKEEKERDTDRLDEEIRRRQEEYTEEDKAFLEELWESIREFNE